MHAHTHSHTQTYTSPPVVPKLKGHCGRGRKHERGKSSIVTGENVFQIQGAVYTWAHTDNDSTHKTRAHWRQTKSHQGQRKRTQSLTAASPLAEETLSVVTDWDRESRYSSILQHPRVENYYLRTHGQDKLESIGLSKSRRRGWVGGCFIALGGAGD